MEQPLVGNAQQPDAGNEHSKTQQAQQTSLKNTGAGNDHHGFENHQPAAREQEKCGDQAETQCRGGELRSRHGGQQFLVNNNE
jgi:hypothetical protein